jgi:hypothetical protein
MLQIGMLKGYMDGSLGSRTAALNAPYNRGDGVRALIDHINFAKNGVGGCGDRIRSRSKIAGDCLCGLNRRSNQKTPGNYESSRPRGTPLTQHLQLLQR